MAILVAASPCALAIATPAAVLSGIAQTARNGVLIKGGMHLENLGAVKAIAFDKTGTLTEGKLQVTDIKPLNKNSPEQLLKIAAAVESRSDHPLAKAIVAKADEQNLKFPESKDLQSISGKGVRAKVDDQPVWIGNKKLFNDVENHGLSQEIIEQAEALESEGKTTMIVKYGEKFLGIIALADQPRKEAKSTIDKLKTLGIRALIMITGDNERVAATISKQLGLTDFRASLLPEEKVAAVEQLLAEHGQVAMVGDGVNDAPAMTKATVAIAMGAGGTDVALETADIALMADDLSKLPFAVALSRQARRIIKQNLIVSLGMIVLLIPATLFGFAGISIAIVFHEGSTLVVVANALRLLRFR
jgi:Cd2+/Zn2+-exporting ATPase